MSTENQLKKSANLDRILDIIVSLAAVPVLIGALFKILHWTGANTMLMVGLLTEAFIFLVYAIRYMLYPAATVDSNVQGFMGSVNVETKDYSPELKGILAELQKNKPSAGFNLDGVALTSAEVEKIKNGFLQLGNTAESIQLLNNAILSSSQDAIKTQGELKELAENLGKINKVYGGVLSAMKAD